MDRLIKWLATAGGLGRLPNAPGTAGSALGLLIGLSVSRLVGYSSAQAVLVQMALLIAAIGVAVAVSTAAERLFAQHDPGCVVIDEVVGMWLAIALVPPLSGAGWAGTLLAFALFRLFDTLKPPPLKWLATFPGGWGIVLDDLGAGLYTAAILWGVCRYAGLPGR